MKIEIRKDRVTIDGYVNAVARDSRPIHEAGRQFVEQIMPGVFRRAIEENPVQLLLNHDRSRKLGSTESNLVLTEDSIGLRAHAEIADAEVIRKAREHKLKGWSFGFIPTAETMEERAENIPRRHIEGMQLLEVSIIDDRAIPAYEGTLIEARTTGAATHYAETTADEIEYTDHGAADIMEHRARIEALKYYKEEP
ncbi:MAG: HK97 family phage prohead protease [Eubacteriales bacterium]|nr:HK97 family phage prohead protease [Eubacteriales bacterium]